MPYQNIGNKKYNAQSRFYIKHLENTIQDPRKQISNMNEIVILCEGYYDEYGASYRNKYKRRDNKRRI